MIAASAGTLELIERLVSIETTSRLSNLPLIEFVRDYLVGLGVEVVLNYDDAGRKANLFATLDPKDRGGMRQPTSSS
jgi:acetylornithine deacetylase